MSYMETVLTTHEWDVLKTWDFKDFVLALCEAHIGFDLIMQAPFYVLFEERDYMVISDEIGDKLSGKKKGMGNE